MFRKLTYLVFAVALVGSPLAHAATRTFDNDGLDNRWDNALNWSGDTIPVSGDTARVIGVDYALIDDADAFAGELRMTGGSLSWTAASRVGQSATGLFTMEGGTIDSTHNLFVGDDPGGAATFVMTGGSLTLSKRNLKFGLDGAQGAGTISNAVVSVDGDLYIGQKADSVGTLSLIDSTVTIGDDFRTGLEGGTGTTTVSGTTIDGQSDMRVGSGGSHGTFTFSSGTISTRGAVDIGRGAGGVGEFTMTDGTLNVAGGDTINALRFGYQGGQGTGTISGGTVNAAGNLVIGNNVAGDPPVGAQGLLTLIDGVINVGNDTQDQEFSIGKNRGTGVVEMYGGQINVLSGDVRIGETTFQTVDPFEAYPGNGQLTMRGGALSISDSNSLQIGLDGSTGVVQLWGGIIETGDLEIGEPGSGGTLDIRGEGTLVLNGNRMAYVLDLISDGLLTAYGTDGSGSVVDWLYDYNVRNPGKTTVSAIPEPATIALLGFGGLVLRRRKRS